MYKEKIISEKIMDNYKRYLLEQEKSNATIEKYMRDLKKLKEYAHGRKIDKMLLIKFKEHLKDERKYKTSSINSYIVAANRFFEYVGWFDLKIKTYKVQKEIFVPSDKEINKNEYRSLVKAAINSGKYKIAMIVQTICATGIRVSEISALTVNVVKKGVMVIYNKSKERKVLIPRNLQVKLLDYIRKNNIKNGVVFRGCNGNIVDRTWIWREMKKLCEKAGVSREKVFPHNLRHLFARTFYSMYKDVVKLANILGHSDIETTRIYLKEPCEQYKKQLEEMDLLVKS